jgi:patatin-like phospholipase/acyl hydrolase
MAPYRILSLDGGGIRGLISAILLERLEQAHPGFISQVDLFAGTSTGGLLALGLATGRTPAQARQLYEIYGNKVFTDTLLDDVRDLGKLIGAEYGLAPLKEVLDTQFGDLSLAALKKRVLISAFDLDHQPSRPGQYRSWKAKFFHNYPGPESDGEQRVVDVALYTSAAPVYFPTYHGYIDGGVVAGNPSVCALAQALHPPTGGQKLEDIVLLSIGTGYNPKYLEIQDANWGLAQWAPHMISLVLEGDADLADYQCRQILSQRYLRINPRLPEEIDMDAVAKMPLMVQIASQVDLDTAVEWLKKNFRWA